MRGGEKITKIVKRGIDLSLQKGAGGFGGHLLTEDDHSLWAPPYWNITTETFSLGRNEI